MISIEQFSAFPVEHVNVRGKSVAVRALSDHEVSVVREAFDPPTPDLIIDPHGPVGNPRTIPDTESPKYKKAVRELGHNLAAAETAMMMDLAVDGKAWSQLKEAQASEQHDYVRKAAAALRKALSTAEIARLNAAGERSVHDAEARAKKNSSDASPGSPSKT